MNYPDKLILFDGVCNLCDGAINFIIKKDQKRLFRYASLQSDIGQRLLLKYKLPLHNYKTFIYIKKERMYTKSDAILEICKDIGKPWNNFYFVKFLFPLFLRNGIYDLVAKNRYVLLRKKVSCQLPTKEIRDLFIE
jgi:predicted DCC family thiol-disulfide oxidoreductase YuxK